MNVPDGWKLVPVEPTPEMLEATSWPKCAETDYRHMLDAAPTTPVQQDDEALEVLRRIISTWESPWPPGADPMAHVLAEARALLTKRGAA